METYKVGGKLNGADVEKVDIYEICAFLKETVDVLDYPRRIVILNALQSGVTYTFEQLKAKTELSTGSLHHHLKELLRADFIYKTSGRPGMYGRTDAITLLISLLTGDTEPKKETARVVPEQMFMGTTEELMERGNSG